LTHTVALKSLKVKLQAWRLGVRIKSN